MISRRNIIKLFLIFFISFILIEKSFSSEAEKLVQLTVDKASDVLSDNSSKEEKIDKLKNIAKETVDIHGIGLYTLGSHRKIISSEQKQEYEILFEEYFLKTFSSRLAEYTDPKIKVKSNKKLNKNYTIVSSVLIATEKRPEVKIEWRVYTKDPNNLLIRDLIIEGLSLARTHREEFNSIIQSNDGDINALFSKLKEFNNRTD
jgi:phospholipid transport system substrate-binding protein